MTRYERFSPKECAETLKAINLTSLPHDISICCDLIEQTLAAMEKVIILQNLTGVLQNVMSNSLDEI